MAIERINAAALSYQGRNTQKAGDTSKKSVINFSTVGKGILEEMTDLKPVQGASSSSTSDNDTSSEGSAQKQVEALQHAVEEIKKNAKHTEAIYGFHDDTNRVTIKSVDKDTKKVIREYPAEETLDMIAKVWELAGIMVDEKR